MKKILLILISEDLRNALSATLQQEYEVTSCTDVQAGEKLLQLKFDGLIIEMNVDSLSLLDRTCVNLPPVVIALTCLLCDDILRVLNRCGAGYLIRIPCPVDLIKERLGQSLKS